ncbi:MAG: hypothetical protein A2X49_15945 [Lentisphaerae bacterium GWF2_52_8]|nr:MAG: hypothetical protein A2X49_15945 [Lentisphaerae bacterium GWF2_52_8]
MTILLTFILGLASLYLGVILTLYLRQNKLLYHPWRTMDGCPGDVGLVSEEYFLDSGGKKIHAWFIPHPQAQATVLFCHGNAGNISHWLDTLALYHDMKLQTLIFDYHGYGRSEGRPSENSLRLDVEAAWNFLTREKGISPEKIIMIGRSLGGAVAAWQAALSKPGALVLESAFSSLPELAGELYPFFPARLLARERYATIESLTQASCPVLVVQSPEDEIIPFGHGKRLFAAAKGEKTFLELEGSHNDCYFSSMDSYRKGLDSFIASSLHPRESSFGNSFSNPR